MKSCVQNVCIAQHEHAFFGGYTQGSRQGSQSDYATLGREAAQQRPWPLRESKFLPRRSRLNTLQRRLDSSSALRPAHAQRKLPRSVYCVAGLLNLVVSV